MKKVKFIEEFKAFINRGNVIDMAVGVIIGGAFGKITTSLVNDIVMPLIGKLTGGVSVSDWKWVLTEAVLDAEGNVVTPEVAVCYGNLIQTVLDFLLIALVIFCVIKAIGDMKAKAEELKELMNPPEPEPEPEPEKEPEPTKEEVLLTEIRDLLKNKD